MISKAGPPAEDNAQKSTALNLKQFISYDIKHLYFENRNMILSAKFDNSCFLQTFCLSKKHLEQDTGDGIYCNYHLLITLVKDLRHAEHTYFYSITCLGSDCTLKQVELP